MTPSQIPGLVGIHATVEEARIVVPYTLRGEPGPYPALLYFFLFISSSAYRVKMRKPKERSPGGIS